MFKGIHRTLKNSLTIWTSLQVFWFTCINQELEPQWRPLYSYLYNSLCLFPVFLWHFLFGFFHITFHKHTTSLCGEPELLPVAQFVLPNSLFCGPRRNCFHRVWANNALMLCNVDLCVIPINETQSIGSFCVRCHRRGLFRLIWIESSRSIWKRGWCVCWGWT